MMKLPVYLALSIVVCACARHEPGSVVSDREWNADVRAAHNRLKSTIKFAMLNSVHPRGLYESASSAGRFAAWSAAARALPFPPPWEEGDMGRQRGYVLEVRFFLPPVQNLELFGPQPLSTIEQCRLFVDPPTPAFEMFSILPEVRLLEWDDTDEELSAEDKARRRCAALESTSAVFDAAAAITDRLAAMLDTHRELDSCLDGIDDDIVVLKPGWQAMVGAIDLLDVLLDKDVDPRVREAVKPDKSCSGLGSYVPRPDGSLAAEDIWQLHAYREGLAWVRSTLPSEVSRVRKSLGCAYEGSTSAL